jgi:hypothetical protein
MFDSFDMFIQSDEYASRYEEYLECLEEIANEQEDF